MIIYELISAVLQVLLFGLIPFVVFLITKRNIRGFLKYIGILKPVRKTIFWSVVVSIIVLINGILMPFLFPEILELMTKKGTVAGNLKLMGLSGNTLAILAITALIKTSLSEEILFRGFIAKRLIDWLGFNTGNIIQALIFGLMHITLILLIIEPNYPFLIFVFIFSGLAGYILGFIKERVGNGSIIPGWIAHGLANLISFYVIAFLL